MTGAQLRTDQEIHDALKQILLDIGVPQSTVDKVDWDTDLFSKKMFDSVSLVALAVKVEEIFGITIPTAEFEPDNFSSLRVISQVVKRNARPTLG